MFRLYDDLPAAKDTPAEASVDAGKSSWSTALAAQLKPALRKAVPVVGPPPSVVRAAQAAKAPPRPTAAAAVRTAVGAGAAVSSTVAGGAASASLSAVVREEYDPAVPNNYEAAARQRALKRKQDELEEKRRALERQRQELEARRRADTPQQPLPPPPPPPPLAADRSALDVTGDEAFQRRAQLGGGPLPPPPPLPVYPPPPPFPPPPALPPPPAYELSQSHDGLGAAVASGGGGMPAAQRMMEKMGWREGQGLGKDANGMTTPLMMRKTDRAAGIVVSAPPEPVAPTHVLCLCGMVNRGEVDEELEDEVAEECEKYGPVVRVLIFEVTDPTCPPEAAVRIFVQFVRPDAAAKALAAMDGRFFGGRTVRATFFSEARFAAEDLAPRSGELESA